MGALWRRPSPFPQVALSRALETWGFRGPQVLRGAGGWASLEFSLFMNFLVTFRELTTLSEPEHSRLRNSSRGTTQRQISQGISS